MLKKVLSILLVILMVVLMVPVTVSADTTADTQAPVVLDGNGWIGISTAEDFLKIGVHFDFPKNGNYYLQNDINFNGKECRYLVEEFQGNLDGRGFTLYNFKFNDASGPIGVFQKLGTDTRISTSVSNLNIGKADAPIQVSGVANGNEINVGILAATRSSRDGMTDVTNVNVYSNITLEANCSVHVRVGGLIAYCRNVSIVDSSFTGSISVTGDGNAMKQIGGVVGLLDCYDNNRRATVKGCTVDATSINSSQTSGKNFIGGIVGRTMMPTTYVTECDVNATLTANGNVGSVAGAIDCAKDNSGYTTTMLFAVTECTLNAGEDVEVYGYQETSSGYEERIYIYNNVGATDTPSRDIGDFSGEFNAEDNVVWLIDSKEDFAMIGATDATQNYTYSLTGLYRLDGENGVIDMSTASPRTEAVINKNFGGLFDGNGNALLNLNFDLPDNKGSGIFEDLADVGADNAIVMNLNVGSEESIVKFSFRIKDNNNWAGVLTAGNNNKKTSTSDLPNASYAVVVDNVNIYADITRTGKNCYYFVGGFMGVSDDLSMYDCTMNGSFTLTNSEDYRARWGGFVSKNNGSTVMHDVQNYADFTAVIPGVDKQLTDSLRYGGVLGDPMSSAMLYNCANFGDISAKYSDYEKMTVMGGIVGHSDNWTGEVGLFYCSNFGDISAISATKSGIAGACVGSNPGVAFDIAHFANFGTIYGNNKTSTHVAEGSSNRLNVSSDTTPMVDMREGAGVRLSADTGIRFMADVSGKAIERLEFIYGEDNVTCGTLIAPTQFVEHAGAFTLDALEAYSTEVNGFAVGQKAYVNVVAGRYFNNEAGVIAGSLLTHENDFSLYNVELSGIAYVTVKDDDGNVINTFYADNAQTRTICNVAIAALDDVKDTETTEGGYTYALEVGETYYVDGEVQTVATENSVYSCYTKTQRDTVRTIIANSAANGN